MFYAIILTNDDETRYNEELQKFLHTAETTLMSGEDVVVDDGTGRERTFLLAL